jgi:hypothetical protein
MHISSSARNLARSFQILFEILSETLLTLWTTRSGPMGRSAEWLNSYGVPSRSGEQIYTCTAPTELSWSSFAVLCCLLALSCVVLRCPASSCAVLRCLAPSCAVLRCLASSCAVLRRRSLSCVGLCWTIMDYANWIDSSEVKRLERPSQKCFVTPE